MAVAVVMEFEGATTEQYDQVLEKMGLTPGGPGPAGAISHSCVATDAGLLITDVWQTAEQYQEFAETQIGPFSAEVGLPGPPKLTMHEVHNYFTPGA